MIDVRMFTVGGVAENCFIVRAKGSRHALVIDPGDEADRLIEAIGALGIEQVDAILVTHTHFDHIGAVAPLAKATGAPVWCPELERGVLANIMAYVPWPGFGPYESYHADHTVRGGETLELAGLTIEVLFTPGHSPGHVTYAIRDEPDDSSAVRNGEAGGRADRELAALFSGDVLFQGSVGRVDLPGGDWPTLLASIEMLVDEFPPETMVYPGHMGVTTLGREQATNPFLRELAH
jgi:glyoxylase-like metal-dependent hydrolase (beta-lactamase superfamily II)